MAKIVVAITGASGVVYGTELVNWLLINGHQVYLVLSDPAIGTEAGTGLGNQGLSGGCKIFCARKYNLL